LMVLTGEPGTGKTTVLHCFLDWLRLRERYSTAYIFHTLVPSTDLLQLILKDFGIPFDRRSKGEMIIALMSWLSERHKRGDCPVIVIDEAQALTNASLEGVRLLLNAEVRGVKLVQIVLAGQLQLEEKLRLPQMAQLRQRMMCCWRLLPLTQEETAGYIAKRLAWAGSNDMQLFPAESIREIYGYSKGIPRVINLLCEHALLSAYACRRKLVELADVVSVAEEFELEAEVKAGKDPSRTNAFCRLSVSRALSVETMRTAEAAATPVVVAAREDGEKETTLDVLPVLAGSAPLRVVPATPTVPRAEPILAIGEAATPPAHSQIAGYWRGVGESFVRDSQQLLEPVREWLTTPRKKQSSGAPSWDSVVRSVRSWLLKPTGSTAILASRPRKPSTSWKHP